MDILHKDSLNDRRSLFYSSREIYVHDENPLSFFEPRGVELGIGEHTFDFIVRLEKNLPSSFKGRHGSIKYKLRVMIQKPWSFDEKHIIPLSIVRHIMAPEHLRLNPIPLTRQITKTISIFGNRPISITSVLPEPFAIRNENIKLFVTVANNSNINVEKLKFSIVQLITFYSFVPLRTFKMDNVVIFQKEAGNVQKKSERTFAHDLLVPACQPSDSELSRVIKIGYEMRIEAVLHGFFKNLVMTLPFTIYSGIGGYISGTFPPTSLPLGLVTNVTASGSGCCGNPFETTANTTYPQLDTSLSSVGSPSHSSQYSETSSIHSTTSDSSAATLSPAVGGTALSYASDTSSQFNSPSVRSSIRSSPHSAVPHVPSSCSPSMANSYPPPYPVPESPSPHYTTYMTSRQLNEAIVQAIQLREDDLPAPSLSFFNRRQPPGATDLRECFLCLFLGVCEYFEIKNIF